jgi:hypothetical protein
VVHLLSTALGLFLVVISATGLFIDVADAWFVWLVGAAGLVLMGAGAIDRRVASHVKRAQALVLIAVALGGGLLIGRSGISAPWFFATTASVTALAFAGGLAALARP